MTSYTLFSDSSMLDNLVHNRMNFKWYPTKNIKVVTELRNRFFVGDQVRKNPIYDQLLKTSNDHFDWTYTIEDKGNYIFFFMIDRAYGQYTRDRLEVKMGRQRINWGISAAWNPNDIFNAFSYFNFDYEERPGSDALSVKYYTGIASSVEVAAKLANDLYGFTGAALWKFNKYGYDFQLLSGVTKQNMVIGGGWAGNISKAGFKGETSYFAPMENAVDKTEVLVASLSLDYSFKNSLYLNGSALYNSNGSTSPSFLDQILYYKGNISAKNLSPYRWSAFLQGSYQFHPLVTGGMAVIGYPGSKNIFLGPYAGISILQNLDLDFFAQIMFSEIHHTYQAATQAYFVRFKYSF